MSYYRFILEPYSGKTSRFTCPECNTAGQFTKYIDTETGTYISDLVGICNRKSKCGYHYSPKNYFRDNSINYKTLNNNNNDIDNNLVKHFQYDEPINLHYDCFHRTINKTTRGIKKESSPDFIDQSIFHNSLSDYNTNNLVLYLDSILDKDTVDHLINIFKIGTSSKYNGGSTIFWQIDISGNIRTGKIIKYDAYTGKRIKKPYVAANWIHSTHYSKEFKLHQCLFGEHLLKEDLKAPVAIVESEKTAIIAQAKMPNYLWMATGSLYDFKAKKLNVLKDRKVTAFPDIGGYDYWLKKASELEFNINVSDYLEKNASNEQREQGLDIADFL